MQDGGNGNDGGGRDAAPDWMQIPAQNDPNYETKMGAVYGRLGRPASANDYRVSDPKDFQFDDADKEYRKSFRAKAHALHLTNRQVQGLEAWQIQNAKVIRDAARAARENAPRATRAALEREMGAGYGDRLKGAFANMQQIGVADLANVTLQDGSRLGDKLEFVRM